MIELKDVSKYKNVAVNSTNGYKIPTYHMSNEASFYLSIIAGSRNSGKTNCVINILEIEKDIMLQGENIVYWISSTKDDKVVHLLDKYPDNIQYHDELTRKSFEDILEEIQERIMKWKQDHYILNLFSKYLKKANSIDENELNVLTTSGLIDMDENEIKELIKTHNFNHPPISTIVVDDNLGSTLISGANTRDGKWFVKFIIRHRHELCNVFILTQHYKMVSKPIRSNANSIIMFASKDAGIADSVFNEFSPLFNGSKDNYHEALSLVENTPHGFLNIWYDKNKWVRLNFDKQIVMPILEK